MALRDELGIRMKNFYESVPKTKLLRRTPVAIRIDGKAFHSFTRGMKKPFDFILIESMQKTMQYLCENIQGCVLGYTQSDEITLLLIDYKRLNSDAWFDYEVQKMCSIAASMTTMAFNRYFAEAAAAAMEDGVYAEALDAARNSVQMVGQANFSHKQLQGKSCEQIQDMLMQEKMFNWNELETCLKRGSCCVRKENAEAGKSNWIIDREIPQFKGDGREYIEKRIFVGES